MPSSKFGLFLGKRILPRCLTSFLAHCRSSPARATRPFTLIERKKASPCSVCSTPTWNTVLQSADAFIVSGILDHTRTKLGRALLRQWLLRPSLDIEVITARHDALSCFLSADNLAAVDAMQTHLKGIKNVPRRLATLRSGKGGIQEWTSLVKVSESAYGDGVCSTCQ